MGMEDLKRIQTINEKQPDTLNRNKLKPIGKTKLIITNNEMDSQTEMSENPKRRKQHRFEDSHMRFTSYFRMDLYLRIEKLRNEGKIESLTSFINDAVKKHLDNFYI